jgi:aryl-alcohol dehydrogenase-like predicted oxidoreductase
VNKSRFILGSAQLGLNYGINNVVGKPTPDEALELLREARLKGIRVLDTAEGYGTAQEIIGVFQHANGKPFLVNTKFSVSDESLSNQAKEALETLNTEFINVYFYHRFHDFVQYPEIKMELIKLKGEGVIKYCGISVYDNDQLKIAAEDKTIDVIQVPFNLLDNFTQKGALLIKAKEMGKVIQARSVFLQGLFFKNEETYPIKLEPLKKYVRMLKSIALESSLDMASLALAYVFSRPEIDEVVIGIDNTEQLNLNLNQSEIKLESEIVKIIESIMVHPVNLLYPTNWS